MLHRAYEAWPSVCFKMVTMMQRDRIFERLLGNLIFLDLALFPDEY